MFYFKMEISMNHDIKNGAGDSSCLHGGGTAGISSPEPFPPIKPEF
ncbi:MAG: hypothetical protein KBC62_02465 [Candidatus Pacebacteria bacterium]|nr:hypothetical protein [Candidatus Paceibacterota bacterium]